ncbi:MAG: helix-turn-helix transcriptional regulator [Bacteroides sp.]|nr:helix-turn-helix transcriptional regulator [Bacteroides sp.]
MFFMERIIARNIKKLREISGYTQEEMANALGITRSAYSNYESGSREVPYDVLEKASDFFGCDMVVLFEENENAEAQILASAFRVEGIDPADAVEIRHFKDIVKSYLKMDVIAAQ